MQGKMFNIKEGEKIHLEDGMLFEDVYHFRSVLRDYSVKRGFKLVRIKNEKSSVTAHCGLRGCDWSIHASPLLDGVTYKIKTHGPDHTCLRLKKDAEATANWIGEKLTKTLRGNPDMTLEAMHEELNQKYEVEITRMKLYRGNRKAIEIIEGNHTKSYAKLPMHIAKIRKTNPRSLVKIEMERIHPNVSLPTFKRLFVAFAAIQKGFKKGCRPFIGVDVCHLKGPFGGMLLTAVALDGNNCLFPLAFGVVETKCKESWAFFLYYLCNILPTRPESKPWTIMSNGQRALNVQCYKLSLRQST